jgi:hypothetical protein
LSFDFLNIFQRAEIFYFDEVQFIDVFFFSVCAFCVSP